MDVVGRNQGRLICLKKRGPFPLTAGKIQDGTCRKFGGVLPNSLSVIFQGESYIIMYATVSEKAGRFRERTPDQVGAC